MTQTSTKGLEALRATMGGSVVTADDPGYDQARKVWNAAIDRRPAAIANCTSALDVVAAVRFAQDRGLEIAVRGGCLCPTPEMLVAEREWVRSLWDAVRPHMMGFGTYLNAFEEQDDHRVRVTYGPKYDRRAAIKAKHDRDNVFHRNVNIKSA